MSSSWLRKLGRSPHWDMASHSFQTSLPKANPFWFPHRVSGGQGKSSDLTGQSLMVSMVLVPMYLLSFFPELSAHSRLPDEAFSADDLIQLSTSQVDVTFYSGFSAPLTTFPSPVTGLLNTSETLYLPFQHSLSSSKETNKKLLWILS